VSNLLFFNIKNGNKSEKLENGLDFGLKDITQEIYVMQG